MALQGAELCHYAQDITVPQTLLGLSIIREGGVISVSRVGKQKLSVSNLFSCMKDMLAGHASPHHGIAVTPSCSPHDYDFRFFSNKWDSQKLVSFLRVYP